MKKKNQKINNINKLLVEARLSLGISQQDVAEQLGYKSSQFISNWERGASSPPLDKLLQISNILKINPEKLMTAILTDTEMQIRSELMPAFKTNKRRYK